METDVCTRRTFLRKIGGASFAGVFAGSACASRALAATPYGSNERNGGVAQTVLGPLDASKLGFTLPHEHVAETSDVLKRWPRTWGGRAEFVAKAVDKMKLVRAAGVRTIVDLSPYDTDRDIRFLEEVSRKSGLNVIACTGQRFFPPISHVEMPSRTLEGLADFFGREADQGIDGTNIKAGVIKIGIGAKLPTDLEEIGLRAAARTSKATGLPIRIHTAAALRAGESIAVILEDENLNPTRVSFDHSDDTGDMDYFFGLAKRGYSLSMDHVHRGRSPKFKPSYERRAECIKLLVDAGFADKIFLSQDSEFGGALLPEKAREWRETTPWDPSEGLFFITRNLVPYLRKIGVPDPDIHIITVENPRRFFSRT